MYRYNFCVKYSAICPTYTQRVMQVFMLATLCVVWFSAEVECMGRGHFNYIPKVIKTCRMVNRVVTLGGRTPKYGGFDFVSSRDRKRFDAFRMLVKVYLV